MAVQDLNETGTVNRSTVAPGPAIEAQAVDTIADIRPGIRHLVTWNGTGEWSGGFPSGEAATEWSGSAWIWEI